MKTFVRFACVLALAAAALAASADVRYSLLSFEGNSTGLATAFVTSDTYLTSVSGTVAGQPTQYVLIALGTGPLSGTFTTSVGAQFGFFTSSSLPVSALSTPGSYDLTLGNRDATFTTALVQATPEPSTLAGFGLGAVAFVKRRKRA